MTTGSKKSPMCDECQTQSAKILALSWKRACQDNSTDTSKKSSIFFLGDFLFFKTFYLCWLSFAFIWNLRVVPGKNLVKTRFIPPSNPGFVFFADIFHLRLILLKAAAACHKSMHLSQKCGMFFTNDRFVHLHGFLRWRITYPFLL